MVPGQEVEDDRRSPAVSHRCTHGYLKIMFNID
jgi:hypothetical protein